MRFAAIDFETATGSRDSACSLGVCVVDDARVVDIREWLIQPPGNEYNAFNTQLHGIGPEQTADEPDFGQVIDMAMDYVDGLPLVAHNASFDMSVLRSGLDSCGRPYPTADYFCTLVMSRAHWPTLPGHSLPIVLAQCGMTHEHHDAAEDARAAAEVMLRIARDLDRGELVDAASALGVSAGRLERDWYSPCSGASSCRQPKDSFRLKSIEVATEADQSHPFFDADVAFTGTLISMSRPEAMQLVADRGGRPRTSVSRLTEYLVVGSVEYRSLLTGAPSRKMQAALDLRVGGAPIEILSEQEFLEYL